MSYDFIFTLNRKKSISQSSDKTYMEKLMEF